MSDGFNAQIIKIPTKVRVFHLLSYLLPVAVYSFVLFLTGEFTAGEIVRILSNPIILIAIVVVDILVPTLIYNYFMALIKKYDATPESVTKVNKEIKTFDLLHVGLVLLNILITTTVVISVCSYMGLKPDPMSIVSSGAGCVFLFGFFPFIFWTQYFEEALAPIPFTRAEIPVSFVMRNVLLILFSLLGILFFTVAPIFVLENEKLEAIVLFMTKMLPCGGIALVVSITNMAILQVNIQGRIDPLTKFAYNLSKRDYTQDNLKVVSRDEIGFLTENMNEFITTTRSLLVAMADSIDASKKSASILSDKMTETSSAVTEINANIENIKTRVINQSAGVEEADATIQSMVQKMNSLAGSVERQSSDIANSSSAVEEMVANIRSVSDILVKNSASVNNLTAASDTGRVKVEQSVEQARTILEDSAGLLEASDIIQNIAEQTNLLAMNAAIEAAHAGEAGKGFAVVSDEIRKLAEQSNTQGKTISAQLEKLQQSISDITTATKEVQDQFGIIFNLAETVKNQETVVEHAMQEQSAGSAQVLDSIKSMKQSTSIIQSGSSELENGTKEVSAEMQVLSEVTEEINGAMAEISNGALTILASVNDVNENSEANFVNLTNLTEEISKFAIRKR